jgi:hypothetical protein
LCRGCAILAAGVAEEAIDCRIGFARQIAVGVVDSVVGDRGRVGAGIVSGQVADTVFMVGQRPKHAADRGRRTDLLVGEQVDSSKKSALLINMLTVSVGMAPGQFTFQNRCFGVVVFPSLFAVSVNDPVECQDRIYS